MTSAALALSVTTILAAAPPNGPPQLNVTESCNAAARGAIVEGRDKQACLNDENAARLSLTQTWDHYSQADRSLCVGMNETGGPSSYVELLSCLEAMHDTKPLQNDPLDRATAPITPSTTGAAPR